MSAVRRFRRIPTLAVIAFVVVIASGCQVRTDVDLRVDPDGSGTVAVTVNLDREAAAQVPDLASQLRVKDLQQAGWQLRGPTATAGGGVRVSATKRFGRPSQAGAVLEELAGRNGPFSGFTVTRSHSFARTTWVLRGTVDLHRGLASFSDQRLTALLGGTPFGRSQAELVRLAHGSLADAAPFHVRVSLPTARPRDYVLRLGDQALPIDAVSRETNSNAYLLGAGALIALVGAFVLFALGGRARRRPPRAQRGMGAYQRRPYEAIRDTESGPAPGTGGTPELVRLRRPAPKGRPNAPRARPPQRRPDDRSRSSRPPGPRPPRPRRPPEP